MSGPEPHSMNRNVLRHNCSSTVPDKLHLLMNIQTYRKVVPGQHHRHQNLGSVRRGYIQIHGQLTYSHLLCLRYLLRPSMMHSYRL